MKGLAVYFALLLVALTGPAASSDMVYLTILSGNGNKPPFEVTDAVIAKVGVKAFKALLPGMDDHLHDAKGPLVRDLIAAAGLEGQTAVAVALDNYEIEIPVKDFGDYDVIVATDIDGRPMSVREKGPAWIVYPSGDHPELRKNAIYEARSIWQLKELTIK